MIDGFVTGLPCLVLGLFFKDFFERSPGWSALVGFVITTAYFSIMSSSVLDGKTVGHRLCGVQVVNGDGSSLSLGSSLLRCSILLAPLLSDSSLDGATSSAIRTGVYYLLSFATLAIFYLFIFNRRTRQSLHDLAVGAFVVEAPAYGRVEAPPFWRMHWLVLAAIVLVFCVATSAMVPRLLRIDPFPELASIPAKVQELPIVRDASVELRKSTVNGDTRTGLIVKVSCTSTPVNYERTSIEIVAAVMQADPRVAERDYLQVVFLQGFKIGFAQFHNNRTVSHTPSDWTELIKASGIS